MSRTVSQNFINFGVSVGNFTQYMATNVWNAETQSLMEDTFLGFWTGSKVNWGVLGLSLEGAVKDNEYLSGVGEGSNRDPKSTNSSAQIFALILALMRLPKGTAMLWNTGECGRTSPPDPLESWETSSWTAASTTLGSLSTRALETRTATGREHFTCQDSGISQIFLLIISNGEKILSNVNVVVWKQVKRENSSLPVAVRNPKTCGLSSLISLMSQLNKFVLYSLKCSL